MNTYRNPRIANIEAEMHRLREAAIAEIRGIQATCQHEKVVQSADRRICCVCGLEERNAYLTWPGQTADAGHYEFARPAKHRTVLNSEFIKTGNVVATRVQL